MSNKYKFDDLEGTYFTSTSVVDWVDVFTRRDYKDILIDSLKFCVKKKGLIVHAYVIMSNHFHLIISRSENALSFSDILRDLKKYTAMHLIKAIRENPVESRKKWMLEIFEKAGRLNGNNTMYQFWQQDNHPIHLEGDWIEQKLDYIHYNPVEAGWVDEPEAYLYSSARNYAGLESPMKIVSVYDGSIC
ncbi:MAG: transposase [Cyclobacteriaceae bacterium]